MDPTTTSPAAASESPSLSPTSDQIMLTETDRSRLQTFVHLGHESARARTRAQVLLKLGEAWSLNEVCRAFDVCRNTVLRLPRLQAGDADRLPRNCFRLWDQRFTVRGPSPRAVSSGTARPTSSF